MAFAGSTPTIKLETDVTLTGFTCWIKYRKPDKTSGYYVATIDPADASKMYYKMTAVQSNYVGEWTFWAYYFDATNVGIGEIATTIFKKEGQK
jgi:hypothetical protein